MRETRMKASIQVNAGERLGKINRNIYGVMFENCGRCVYDGLWVGEDSAIPNWNGIRKDMLGLLKSMRTPVIRWPGWTPSDRHHWREGIGPRDQRPRSVLAGGEFGAPPETYAFATDEYLALAREVGFTPYICANVGTGTAEEAAQWVEYCNARGNSTLAALRAANGHPKPYGVKYWGIGNECYFWHDAKAYAKVIRHYAKLMRMIDPTIKLVAAGHEHIDDWNRTILEEAGDSIDYISIHVFYTHTALAVSLPTLRYEDYVAAALRGERSIRRMADLIRQATGDDRIRIVVDEWAVWNKDRPMASGAEHNLALKDALCVAGMFHVFHRTRDIVDMGIVANLVNSTNMVLTLGDKICLSPAYHALQLYAAYTGDTALGLEVEVDSYHVDSLHDSVPFLDCSATLHDEQEEIVLSVVNRSREASIECAIELDGCTPRSKGKAYEINGASIDARNDFDSPDTIVTVERPLIEIGREFSYTFPAHSITLLRIRSDS